MFNDSDRLRWRPAFVLTCVVLGCIAVLPSGSQQQDNSAVNKDQRVTAQSQAAQMSDRQITAKIRRSVVSDKTLSTYAHNAKIITQGGAVVLKGPVHSEDERKNIEAKAAAVVGQDKVTDQLTIKQ